MTKKTGFLKKKPATESKEVGILTTNSMNLSEILASFPLNENVLKSELSRQTESTSIWFYFHDLPNRRKIEQSQFIGITPD